MTDLDQELVDLYYAERPGMDRNVVAAFVWAGQEPPPAQRFTTSGLTASERTLVDDYYSKFEPHGPRKVTMD